MDSSIHKNNDSHVSGVSPFFSSEDINVSINQITTSNESVSEISKTVVRFALNFCFTFAFCRKTQCQVLPIIRAIQVLVIEHQAVNVVVNL